MHPNMARASHNHRRYSSSVRPRVRDSYYKTSVKDSELYSTAVDSSKTPKIDFFGRDHRPVATNEREKLRSSSTREDSQEEEQRISELSALKKEIASLDSERAKVLANLKFLSKALNLDFRYLNEYYGTRSYRRREQEHDKTEKQSQVLEEVKTNNINDITTESITETAKTEEDILAPDQSLSKHSLHSSDSSHVDQQNEWTNSDSNTHWDKDDSHYSPQKHSSPQSPPSNNKPDSSSGSSSPVSYTSRKRSPPSLSSSPPPKSKLLSETHNSRDSSAPRLAVAPRDKLLFHNLLLGTLKVAQKDIERDVIAKSRLETEFRIEDRVADEAQRAAESKRKQDEIARQEAFEKLHQLNQLIIEKQTLFSDLLWTDHISRLRDEKWLVTQTHPPLYFLPASDLSINFLESHKSQPPHTRTLIQIHKSCLEFPNSLSLANSESST
ncbi:uncharacterized protein LOC126324516 [Schistocerca gregaria]|uniref:uncharacterized protein LOC126324516 n=1 Tax=Schistocerca gregaria TaxID=7010 RepID=UPI00211DF1F8|nr:uncharacterized protein LOC126324516 [Schistocerca gregaria]